MEGDGAAGKEYGDIQGSGPKSPRKEHLKEEDMVKSQKAKPEAPISKLKQPKSSAPSSSAQKPTSPPKP